MARRGRPRHPDILTPREWEVLAFLREGLSNEQIAQRLDITERTARFHVSEILGKLGVPTRQEAAAWQPEQRRPWWAVFLWRPLRNHWLASSVSGAVIAAGAVALALFVWAIVRTHNEGAPELAPSALAVGEGDACVLLDGAVKCWGRNIWGSLGDGTGQDRSVAVPVIGLPAGVVAISAGAAHTCALLPQGSVKCWGYNFYGQLGNGESGNAVQNIFSPVPIDVIGLSGAVAISAGSGHVCAVTSSNGLKCWGDNAFGQLGDGTTTLRDRPVDVIGLSSGVTAVAAGGNFTCALTDAGAVKCWGSNAQGQLGATTSEQCGSPLYRPPCSATPLDVTGLDSDVAAITAGGQQHICALTREGVMKCWGSNLAGELGTTASATCAGAEPCSNAPRTVNALEAGVVAIGLGSNHTCAITSSGGAKCWGDNTAGQLGDGTLITRATPTDVLGLTNGVVAIGAGQLATCALKSSGAVKCWGDDSLGGLGDGTTGAGDCSCRTTPVDVIGLDVPATASDQNATDPLTCAFNSTQRFLDAQRQAAFTIYCPSYLPSGFRLDTISFDQSKFAGTPPPGLGAFIARFVDDTGTTITFSQGALGNDLFPQWRAGRPPPALGTVLYGGDFDATLYDVWPGQTGPQSAIVWSSSPSAQQHVILGNSTALDADVMRRIAEGMLRLDITGTPAPLP